MPRLKAIFFDLDDTLYDCSGSLVEAARRRAARAMVEGGLPCPEDEAYRMQVDLISKHGPAYRVFNHVAERYGKGREFVETVLHAYNRSEVEDIHPFPEVVSVLRNLRSQGYLLFLVTSGVHRRQDEKIKLLGIGTLFDEVVINDSEIGASMEESLKALLLRNNLTPQECMMVGDRVDSEIRVANSIKMTTVQMLHGRYESLLPKNQLEQPNFRISHLSELHDVLVVANKRRHCEQSRILCIGGGTGLPMVLQGLKAFSRNLTAVVTVTDSGRSSGKLRRDLGVLPPGDARNCLIALSSNDKTGRQLLDLFQYRFEEGGLAGMSFGNLFLAALEKITGSFEQALRAASEILAIDGKVIPSTLADTHLCALLKDGSIVREEYNVRGPDKAPIEHVFLDPEDAAATDEAINEIEQADTIVIGPGSLYTSVITNLLVRGITRAIRRSEARVIYISNIVTQPGQTDNYTAADHVRAIQRYLGEGSPDYVLVNNAIPPPEALKRYTASGAQLVRPDEELNSLGVQVIEANLAEEVNAERIIWEKQDLLRHDPAKLAKIIMELR